VVVVLVVDEFVSLSEVTDGVAVETVSAVLGLVIEGVSTVFSSEVDVVEEEAEDEFVKVSVEGVIGSIGTDELSTEDELIESEAEVNSVFVVSCCSVFVACCCSSIFVSVFSIFVSTVLSLLFELGDPGWSGFELEIVEETLGSSIETEV